MNPPFHLEGKTILVTGASSGIGRQVAISITAMGGAVVVTGRNRERLEETYTALAGDGHRTVIADLLKEDQRGALIDSLPGLDGVVHSVGIVKFLPVKFLSRTLLAETMSINYETPSLLTAELSKSKRFNRGASIVFISSLASQAPAKGLALYSASKAALESFSRTLALEFHTQGIRANCISPAMVKTAMYDEAQTVTSKKSMDDHIRQYPLGVGLPEDVANAAIFLLSDASRWITGTNMVLDGGLSINNER